MQCVSHRKERLEGTSQKAGMWASQWGWVWTDQGKKGFPGTRGQMETETRSPDPQFSHERSHRSSSAKSSFYNGEHQTQGSGMRLQASHGGAAAREENGGFPAKSHRSFHHTTLSFGNHVNNRLELIGSNCFCSFLSLEYMTSVPR